MRITITHCPRGIQGGKKSRCQEPAAIRQSSPAAESPKPPSEIDALRKELLTLVVPMYEQFVKQRSEDADLEAGRGKAYHRLAFVRAELGEAPAAIGDY